MGDLSQFFKDESETVLEIYAWHKKMGDAEAPRNYLGASILGHECERYLWYTFRHCVKENLTGRMYRLFETGRREEARIISELRAIGYTVYDKDSAGKQFGVKAIGGHMAGHMDAVVEGVLDAPKTPHLFECKTAGGTETESKDFEKCQKSGVRVAKPVHYAQMQIYMGLNGLTRALYVMVKKATDELYSERVHFDSTEFDRLMKKAERIIRSNAPLERCADRPDDFRCKFCSAHDLCWGTGKTALPVPAKSCRQCCHATPEIDEGESWASWSCSSHKKDLTSREQGEACSRHLCLPGLISFAEPTDATETTIEFSNAKDKAKWIHGDGQDGTWSTDELIASPGPLVGRKEVEAVKSMMKGRITEYRPPLDTPDGLMDRYPAEDSRLKWEGPDTADGQCDLGKALHGLMQIPTDGTMPEPTSQFEDDSHLAYEFGGRFLLVIYKKHTWAAIWEGVE
jgi:hypothetical protein